MKRAIAYLFIVLGCYVTFGIELLLGNIVAPEEIRLPIYCGLCGGIGGITYCLRAVYLNACVFDRWTEKWLPWYYIRPLVSFICGVVSYIFLKSGLIALEAKQGDNPTNLAFYALAFIAGLNVDKFIEKLEDIAQVSWGIKKSRMSSKEDNDA